jgi:hypothetical protein
MEKKKIEITQKLTEKDKLPLVVLNEWNISSVRVGNLLIRTGPRVTFKRSNLKIELNLLKVRALREWRTELAVNVCFEFE